MTSDPSVSELQRDVQSLLGRCLLRLQQFERLLKTLLTHHEVRSTVDDLQARRSRLGRRVTPRRPALPSRTRGR